MCFGKNMIKITSKINIACAMSLYTARPLSAEKPDEYVSLPVPVRYTDDVPVSVRSFATSMVDRSGSRSQ